MFLREYLRHPRGLEDLTLWACLPAAGVLLNKDGSLTAGFRYHGPDLDSSTPEDLAAQADFVHRALHPLDDAWAVHCDLLRLPTSSYADDPGAFPEPVTRAIDEECRSQTARQLYESLYTILFTWFPPKQGATGLRRLFLSDRSSSPLDEDVLATFEDRIAEIAGALSPALRLTRLGDDELLTHLHTCLTGLAHPVKAPPVPLLLDGLLLSQDLSGGLHPKIGPHHLAVLSLTGLPLATTPGLLDPLCRLPLSFRFNTRFLPLSPPSAERLMRRQRNQWMRSRRGLSWLLSGGKSRQSPDEEENLDSSSMLGDLDAARALNSANAVRFGYYSATVVVYAEEREDLLAASRLIATTLRNAGIPVRTESINALDAFFGTLAPNCFSNLRRPILHTRNLADLLPVTALWTGRPVNPSPFSPPGGYPALLWTHTEGNAPFRLNLHTSDVGHSLVIGPTGSGKSALLSLLMSLSYRYPQARVFAFDKGYSFLPLTLAAGGAHYDVAADTEREISFCPLAEIDDPTEFALCREWLDGIFRLNGITPTPEQGRTLNEALTLLSRQSSRTLTGLQILLQDHTLREALLPYTVRGGGIGGALFDAEADRLATSHLITFETSHLMELGPRYLVPALLHVFRRLEKRLDSGAPTTLILDEAWTFLDHPLFADRLRQWLKELRKKNTAVLFATQSLADFAKSPLAPVLVESTATKIFLPNPQAANESTAPLYRQLGLNSRQLSIIAGARPKRDYYVTSSEGNRLVHVELGPLALAFCGAGSRQEIAQVRDLHRDLGPAWPLAWLHHRGLSADADRLTPSFPRSQP